MNPNTHTSFLDKRYTDHNIKDYPTNSFVENIIGRASCRKFQNKRVNRHLLKKLFAAAQSAPTSSNFQAWSAIVLETPKEREFMFEGINASHMGVLATEGQNNNSPLDAPNYHSVMGCSDFIIWCVDMSRMDQIIDWTFSDEEYKNIFQESRLKYEDSISSLNSSTYQIRSICDAIISAQTFCIAAESVGLATLYCGAIKAIDMKERLKLPDRVLPLFGICVGYRAPGTPVNIKTRLPQNVVTHYGLYKQTDFDILRKYNSDPGTTIPTTPDSWFVRIIKRTQQNFSNRNYKQLLAKYGFTFM